MKELKLFRQKLIAEISKRILETGLSLIETADISSGSSPILINDVKNDQYTYTLDRITVDDDKNIVFEGSSAYDNEYIKIEQAGTDELAGILEWLKDYKKALNANKQKGQKSPFSPFVRGRYSSWLNELRANMYRDIKKAVMNSPGNSVDLLDKNGEELCEPTYVILICDNNFYEFAEERVKTVSYDKESDCLQIETENGLQTWLDECGSDGCAARPLVEDLYESFAELS